MLDDVINEGADSKDVSQLFTRDGHDNMSVIFLTQNLFHPKQRNISLNSDYMINFKDVRDETQFSNLAKQFMANGVNFLKQVFEYKTRLLPSFLSILG